MRTRKGITTSGMIQLGDGSTIKAGINGSGTLEDEIRIWAGATYANRASAPFRVLQSGKVYATASGFLRYECKEAQSFSFSDLTLLETGIIPGSEYIGFNPCEVLPGERLFAFGYPVTEAIETLKMGIDEPFSPIRATGIFKGYSEKVNLGNKTNKPEILINNVGIVEILRDKGTDFSGYSGGLITTEDNRPVGMIVGEHENHLLYINIYNALKKV